MPDSSKKILIVEDDPTVSQMADEVLAGMGFETHVASTGREALDLYYKIHPDLILLDIALPDVNGFEVAKEIRKNEGEGKRAHITIMTAYAQSFFVSMGFEAGIDSYLNKPILPQDLINQVASLAS